MLEDVMAVKHKSQSDMSNDQLGNDHEVALALHATGRSRGVTLKRFHGDDGIHVLTEAA